MLTLFLCTTTAILISSLLGHWLLGPKKLSPVEVDTCSISAEALALRQKLASALPNSVILPQNIKAFRQATDSYWAKQHREDTPVCIVRPSDNRELSVAVRILQDEFTRQRRETKRGHIESLFAVRGGGHSPVFGAASTRGGVLIDLSLFQEVTLSKDETSVTLGTGLRWKDVSKILDEKGFAVVGGRNGDVGVSGLALGGGMSFFSPRFGFVCDNILSYDLVLASGSIVTASQIENPDLYRALKGGSNNFGIVTRFTARVFPCRNLWSGMLYLPSFQTNKVLAAFHDCVNRMPSHDGSSTLYDPYAAGPIVSISYVQAVGIQVIAVHLAHTKPAEANGWPAYWQNSPFRSIWRLWSTCKPHTVTSAMDELTVLNPSGRRQALATTTIKNVPVALAAANIAYQDAIASVKNVKGALWTLVLQPHPPSCVGKDDVNPMGVHSADNKPLVNVSFTVNWDSRDGDEIIQRALRRAVEEIDDAARRNHADHRYRYLNYCGEGQRPFESYGEENLRWLRGVSVKYDPDGLFQKGCSGGFKLG